MRLRVRLTLLFAMAVCQAQGGGPAFPFEFREGLIWVKVQTAKSPQPLNFLLDTGAGVSVLDLGTARRLGLTHGHRVTVQGVGANATGYWPEPLQAHVEEVALPANFLAVDLCQLSTACNCRIDGLIGADFFAGRAVQIDFANRQIRLLASKSQPPGQQVLALKSRGGALRVKLSVNENPAQWFRVDSGCASSLEWVSGESCEAPSNPRVAVALSPVSIRTTETSVQLGGRSFQNVATGLHAKPIFRREAGLLGAGLLARFKSVTIDIPAGQVVLE